MHVPVRPQEGFVLSWVLPPQFSGPVLRLEFSLGNTMRIPLRRRQTEKTKWRQRPHHHHHHHHRRHHSWRSFQPRHSATPPPLGGCVFASTLTMTFRRSSKCYGTPPPPPPPPPPTVCVYAFVFVCEWHRTCSLEARILCWARWYASIGPCKFALLSKWKQMKSLDCTTK